MHDASQEQVYTECASGLVEHVLAGYNATVIACGQIGAGKTYSMIGSFNQYDHRGITPRAVAHLFQEITSKQELSVSIR